MHTVVAPLFERGFIAHSYANRTGKGTHRAVRQYERPRDRYRRAVLAMIKRRAVAAGASCGRGPARKQSLESIRQRLLDDEPLPTVPSDHLDLPEPPLLRVAIVIPVVDILPLPP